MSDLIIAIFLTISIWLSSIVHFYEVETKEEIVALQETNSFLWAEGENTTARLKVCEKKKGRR
jgi:hypothetical protein